MSVNKKIVPVTLAGKNLSSTTDKIKFITSLLINAGFNPVAIPLFVTQIMLESAWLTSPHTLFDNNLSGIKLASSPTAKAFQKQLGVTQGRKAGYNEGNYHAKYPSLAAWAQDYKRILNMGSNPLQALDPSTFVNRLYQNGYFTKEGLTNYNKGFVATFNGIKKTLSNITSPKTIHAPKIGTLIILLGVFFLVFLN